MHNEDYCIYFLLPNFFVEYVLLLIVFHIFKNDIMLGNFFLVLLSWYIWNYIIKIQIQINHVGITYGLIEKFIHSGCMSSHCILVIWKHFSKPLRQNFGMSEKYIALPYFFLLLLLSLSFSIINANSTRENALIQQISLRSIQNYNIYFSVLSIFFFVLFQFYILSNSKYM